MPSLVDVRRLSDSITRLMRLKGRRANPLTSRRCTPGWTRTVRIQWGIHISSRIPKTRTYIVTLVWQRSTFTSLLVCTILCYHSATGVKSPFHSAARAWKKRWSNLSWTNLTTVLTPKRNLCSAGPGAPLNSRRRWNWGTKLWKSTRCGTSQETSVRWVSLPTMWTLG